MCTTNDHDDDGDDDGDTQYNVYRAVIPDIVIAYQMNL